MDDSALLDSEVSELTSDIDRWIEETQTQRQEDSLSIKSLSNMSLHTPISMDESTKCDSMEDTVDCQYSNLIIGKLDSREPVSFDSLKHIEEMDITTDVLSSERSSPKEDIDVRTDVDIKYQDVDVGTFTDKSVPLEYCFRHIVKTLLLTGHPSTLIPDKNVRISVKSLALTCLSSILQYFPRILLYNLDKRARVGAKDVQKLSDILLYIDHNDPQLRGNVTCLVGVFIKSVLLNAQADYEKWLKDNSDEEDKILHLDNIISLLIKVNILF